MNLDIRDINVPGIEVIFWAYTGLHRHGLPAVLRWSAPGDHPALSTAVYSDLFYWLSTYSAALSIKSTIQCCAGSSPHARDANRSIYAEVHVATGWLQCASDGAGSCHGTRLAR